MGDWNSFLSYKTGDTHRILIFGVLEWRPMNRILYSLPVAIVLIGGAVTAAFIIHTVRFLFRLKPRETNLFSHPIP